MVRLGSHRDVRHPLARTGPAGHVRSRQRVFSCFNRHETARGIRCAPPFCPSRMLMVLDDRGVEQQRLQVGVAAKGLQHPLPHALLAPPIVALEYRVPGAKSVGQVASRGSGFGNPKDRIYGPSIIFPSSSWVARATRQQRFNASPLLVGPCVSPFHLAPP